MERVATSVEQEVPLSELRREPKIFVVLPAYNEGDNLASLLARVRSVMRAAGFAYEVILVDDGSSDSTYAAAERWALEMPIRVLRHVTNQGLGRTLADGLDAAASLARPGDIIVTMDADDTHDPALIPAMARNIAQGPDVIVASRYRPGACVRGVPLFRRGLSLGAAMLFRVLFPIRGIRDYTSGYRAYRAGTLQAALAAHNGKLVDQQGFQCMADLLLKLRRSASFQEIPITLRYDLKRGVSKMRIAGTVARTLALVARRRLGA